MGIGGNIVLIRDIIGIHKGWNLVSFVNKGIRALNPNELIEAVEPLGEPAI